MATSKTRLAPPSPTWGLRETVDGLVFVVKNPRLNIFSEPCPSVDGDEWHDVTEDYEEIEKRRRRRKKRL